MVLEMDLVDIAVCSVCLVALEQIRTNIVSGRFDILMSGYAAGVITGLLAYGPSAGLAAAALVASAAIEVLDRKPRRVALANMAIYMLSTLSAIAVYGVSLWLLGGIPWPSMEAMVASGLAAVGFSVMNVYALSFLLAKVKDLPFAWPGRSVLWDVSALAPVSAISAWVAAMLYLIEPALLGLLSLLLIAFLPRVVDLSSDRGRSFADSIERG